MDFEQAIHSALNSAFPTSLITGCYFHVKQAWFKNLKKFGLIKEFQNKDSEIGKWLHLVFVLPLLRSEAVDDCFTFGLMSDAPIDPKLTKFQDYILANFISETARFRPSVWANVGFNDETTNACESFHSHFNSFFYKSHPNILVFVDILLKYQTFVYVKVISSNTNSPVRKFNKKQHSYFENQHRLLHQNIISELDFLKNMSNFISN